MKRKMKLSMKGYTPALETEFDLHSVEVSQALGVRFEKTPRGPAINGERITLYASGVRSHAGGLTAGSRWLSAAIPPEVASKISHPGGMPALQHLQRDFYTRDWRR